MAYLTENLNLQRALLRHISSLPTSRTELLDNTKVTSIQPSTDTWPIVQLSSGRILRTRLLVGADGFNSPVRAFAGISSFGWRYDTQAIVATLEHEPRSTFTSPSGNTTAYQRFLPTGPIAFLPLSETRSSLVWSTKPPLAKALLGADPQVLVGMINAAFRLPEVSIRYLHDRILDIISLGKPIDVRALQEEIVFRELSHGITSRSALASVTSTSTNVGLPPEDAYWVPPAVTAIQPGTAASFPLRFNHADAYIQERVALVGDAAHTIHPLAGQGLNLGLGDVEALVRCIEEAARYGGDIGQYLYCFIRMSLDP
jgi:ubiquinone biosynthesis monooxygenase Coq6